jgi:hypothetical protein
MTLFRVLEPYAVKVASTVLRGERESNLPDLLDSRAVIVMKPIYFNNLVTMVRKLY